MGVLGFALLSIEILSRKKIEDFYKAFCFNLETFCRLKRRRQRTIQCQKTIEN